MPAFIGLILIIGVTVPVAAWLGRRERLDLSPTPWDLADVARRQIPMLSGAAAISITAIVLLVTLVRNQSTTESPAFDTVLTMFLIAFISFVALAIELVFMPLEGGVEGESLPRLLSTIAGVQHYRTLLLAWLALKPLMDTFGLEAPATLLLWLLGVAALAGWLIVSSICSRMGVLRPREAFVLPVIGISLGWMFSLAVFGRPGGGSGTENLLALTLAIFVLNTMTFGAHALLPMLHRHRSGVRWIEHFGHTYVLFDLQATVVAISLLWHALLQPY